MRRALSLIASTSDTVKEELEERISSLTKQVESLGRRNKEQEQRLSQTAAELRDAARQLADLKRANEGLESKYKDAERRAKLAAAAPDPEQDRTIAGLRQSLDAIGKRLAKYKASLANVINSLW